MRRTAVIGGLLLAALVVRNAVFVQLRLFDAVPELVLLVVVTVALTEGPEQAAIVGFAAGILQDLTTTLLPVGLSALAFVIVGFAAGLAHSYVIRPGRLLLPAVAAAATLTAAVITIFAGALVGKEYLVSTYQFVVAAWSALYTATVFLVVYPAMRRVLAVSRLDRARAA